MAIPTTLKPAADSKPAFSLFSDAYAAFENATGTNLKGNGVLGYIKSFIKISISFALAAPVAAFVQTQFGVDAGETFVALQAFLYRFNKYAQDNKWY